MVALLGGEIRSARIEPASQIVGHEQGNPRPVLILSNNRFNTNSQLVIAALITSRRQRPNSPISIPIRSVQMPQPPWILASQIRTLSAQRIGQLIGTLSEDELAATHRTINRIFSAS